MIAKIKKHQRLILVGLIVLCMGVILVGGVHYVGSLRDNLQENAIQNVAVVTAQQRQALDNFVSGDRERLHSFAEYFAESDHADPGEIQRQLTLFNDVDAVYSVMCLDDGWFCSNASTDIRDVDEGSLETYRALSGSGVRESYIGLFSGNPKFGYYETFSFQNGHKGLIQKSYDRTKVSETFSLSFYDGQGLAYVINQQGDILLRSVEKIGDSLHDNIFDLVSDIYGDEAGADALTRASAARETGHTIFNGEMGAYLYTYEPMESVEEWYLVSIVPMAAIDDEAGRILLDSQMALGLLGVVLAACVIFFILIWRTQREIQDKDYALDYQSQMSNAVSEYLATNTDDIYMILDQETDKLEYITPNTERVMGVGQEGLIALMEEQDLQSDPEGTAEYYRQVTALQPGQTVPGRTTERVNPQTGERHYFLENAYCTLIQDIPKRLVYISDRTKERKSQDNLSEALHMAQAANAAKSAFLSSVSHDIRTPMNAIIGFLGLMQNETDNPSLVKEYTQRIDAASQHLLGLINDVLDMNKIESGGTTLSISEMSLADVIDEINTIIRPQTKAKDQEFDIFVTHLEYEHLLGDKLRVNQVLINLLSNAVKYTPDGGHVELKVEELPRVVKDYSRIRFTVSDDGLGMSEEYQKVIFDPFTREETKVTHEIQGTGLGMAITKSLVDLMGGSIHVTSQKDKGTTFVVELELRIQEKENDPQFWEEHRVMKMLVADDEEEVCQNIRKAMARVGVQAEYSTDGAKAISMVRAAREAGSPYDLILLDWKMPGLNGLETARLIRQNYPERIPILLLTAYDWSEIEQEAMEIGVDHFMPKPFFMSTFRDAVRRLMGGMKKTKGGPSDVVKGKNILVVDDIEVNRIILVKILTSLEATCDMAANGQEAVEKVQASAPGQYDLVLMDVQMPVMDGYEATRAIRESGHPSAQSLPIIAMTANAFVDDVRDAINSGMDAHIAKPVQLDMLKATIQQVLEKRKGNV